MTFGFKSNKITDESNFLVVGYSSFGYTKRLLYKITWRNKGEKAQPPTDFVVRLLGSIIQCSLLSHELTLAFVPR